MTIFIFSVGEYIYSTNRILEEAKKRGHHVRVVNHTQCTVKLSNHKRGVYYKGRNIIKDATAIIPRIGNTTTDCGMAIVKEFEYKNVFSTSSSSGIGLSQNKIESIQFLSKHKIPIPDTLFSINTDSVNDQINLLGGAPIIIKSHEGTQGKGVMLAESNQSAKSIIDTMYSMNKRILLQEFIKESKSEDIRAFVVGDKVVASMKRTGVKNDFRSNIHLGGKGSVVVLSKEEEQVAIKTAQLLGLKVAGVDLIRSKRGLLVLEVNSTPGLQGIEEYTKVNVAEEIIKYIEKDVLK